MDEDELVKQFGSVVFTKASGLLHASFENPIMVDHNIPGIEPSPLIGKGDTGETAKSDLLGQVKAFGSIPHVSFIRVGKGPS